MTDEIMTEEIVEAAKSKVAEELEYLKSKGYCCQKRVEEILGCQTDLEPIGNLAFICEKEFYLRPQWSYVGRKNKGFTALLKFDDFLVCTAKSQNKKGAKIACAENSLCLVAPQIFQQVYPNENFKSRVQQVLEAKLEFLDYLDREALIEENSTSLFESPPVYETITLNDPRLPTLTIFHRPYAPYAFLKQAFCQALHLGKYKLEVHEKENKQSTTPEDTRIIYMQLRKLGKTVYEETCTSSSLKKGKAKLAIGILKQMHGENKKWADVMNEMQIDILKQRETRDAGDKPVKVKYDPNFAGFTEESSDKYRRIRLEEELKESKKISTKMYAP